jgi:hypothetical protein
MEVQESNLVSPTDGNKEGSQPNLNLLLQQGGRDDEMDFEPLTNDLLSSSEDDDEERSPAKKKGKKRATFSGELTRSNHPVECSKNTAQTNPEIPQDKTTTKQPKPTSKAPKPAFKSPPPHFYTHPRNDTTQRREPLCPIRPVNTRTPKKRSNR